MRRGGPAPLLLTLSLACLLGASLAGCILAPDDGLVAIFGEEHVWGSPGERTLYDVLVARVLEENGTGEWVREVRLDAAADLILEKDHPGPHGGGGETHDLPALAIPPIQIRFDVAPGSLDNFTVRWTLNGIGVVSDDGNESDSIILRPATVGVYTVGAALVRDGAPVAATYEGIRILVTGTWTIDSSVYPLRPQGAPEPPNYDEMRDHFRLDVATSGTALTLETMFRGTYDLLRDGTDVDLGLHDAVDQPLDCVGSGGDSAISPDPAAAQETIAATLQNGTHTVHVGALRPDCSGSAWYHNQGPVPYRLIVVADPSG